MPYYTYGTVLSKQDGHRTTTSSTLGYGLANSEDEARAKAFEEAAKVARDCALYDANDQLLNSDIRATCAQAIRAMIDKG